jgi:lycopene cyclase CruA
VLSEHASALSRLRERIDSDLIERLVHLDRVYAEPTRAPATGRPLTSTPSFDFDVIFVGGGLSLIHAPLCARRGLRVAVVDRAKIGETHREWNASRRELDALSDSGLLTPEEVEAIVVARYRHGICRWFEGGTYEVRGALDCAVSAEALMSIVRARALEAGVQLFDHCEIVSSESNAHGGVVVWREGNSQTSATARVIVEARGAAFAIDQADLICPTVGGVITGLAQGQGQDEVDPQCGEILVTTEHLEDGRQHIWEGFPGTPGATTVYLFYYAPMRRERHSLLSLYDRFFKTLPQYKRGEARVSRPTFGFIPGWSRLTNAPRAPSSKTLLVGDAAARHSPLTYCGFGAALRALRTVPDAVERVAAGGAAEVAVADSEIHRFTGALARMMATPSTEAPGALNQLLDAAFGTLHEMGNEPFASLLRDEMSPGQFVQFLARTSLKVPRVYRDVIRDLGVRDTARWLGGLARANLRERTARH